MAKCYQCGKEAPLWSVFRKPEKYSSLPSVAVCQGCMTTKERARIEREQKEKR